MMDHLLIYAIYVTPWIIFYLVGSIPFGLILTKMAGHGDIRSIGSGNIGATNVLRTGNKKLALATLLLDGCKGAFCVFLYIAFLNSMSSPGDIIRVDAANALKCGLGGIAGHCFPVWLKFKGGKGVATGLGTFLAAVPVVGLIACATWLLAAFAFRISSLSAIIAMIVAPITTFVIYGLNPALIAGLISALVIAKHHQNIRRIIKGEEPKIGKKTKDANPA